jgi:hypothetical protein
MNYIDEVKEELAKHIKVGKGLMNVYALLVLVKGEDCTLKDIHDACAVNININWDKSANGEHRSLIPFKMLSEETQEKDRGYMEAVQKTARMLAASER